MKNGVFWDITPCGLCKNRRFEELSASIIGVTRIGELGITLAVVTAKVVPSSPILVTLMMEALHSFETSVLTRVTGRKIPEDAIVQGIVSSEYLGFPSQFLICQPCHILYPPHHV
jgi:hypothetical protein